MSEELSRAERRLQARQAQWDYALGRNPMGHRLLRAVLVALAIVNAIEAVRAVGDGDATQAVVSAMWAMLALLFTRRYQALLRRDPTPPQLLPGGLGEPLPRRLLLLGALCWVVSGATVAVGGTDVDLSWGVPAGAVLFLVAGLVALRAQRRASP